MRIRLAILALCLFATPVYAGTTNESAMVRGKSYLGNEMIRYPEIYQVDTAVAAKINAVMRDVAKKSYAKYVAVKAAEKKVSKAKLCTTTPRCHYSFNSLYRVMYDKNGKLSIYYSEYTYTGGKSGTSKIRMYNFSLKTGKAYKLSDLLTSKKDYQHVREYAFTYLRTHKPYMASVKKLSEVKVGAGSRFIFGDDGFYLFFTGYKGYEPSAYDDGDPYIKIPSRVYK